MKRDKRFAAKAVEPTPIDPKDIVAIYLDVATAEDLLTDLQEVICSDFTHKYYLVNQDTGDSLAKALKLALAEVDKP